MPPFRTILVAADFSLYSREAFRMACCLAHRDQARLLVLHVVEPLLVAGDPVYFGQKSVTFAPDTRPSEYYDARKDSLKALYVPDAPIATEYLARDGEPAPEILRLAEEARCDLIAMGTQGRTGLERVLTGSVAEGVLRRARCPVLTLRSQGRSVKANPVDHIATRTFDRNDTGDAPDPSAGNRAQDQDQATRPPIRCLLHPTDFTEGSNAALRVARSIAREQGARLILLHVIPLEPAPIEVPPLWVDRGPFQNALESMRASGEDGTPNDNVEIVLRDGVPEAEILRMAQELECDLIVMGTHGRSGLGRWVMGSVAEQVLRLSECPVLTVRAADVMAIPAQVDERSRGGSR